MAFMDTKFNVDALAVNTYRTGREIGDVMQEIVRYVNRLQKDLADADIPDDVMKHVIVEARNRIDVCFLQLFDSVDDYQDYVKDFKAYMENNNGKC